MKIDDTWLKRLFAGLVSVLVVAELLLVLVSWLLSATMAENVRSLLSSEGIRWFVGSFISLLSTPWLAGLLLLSMAGGSLWQSGLLSVFTTPRNYRQRVALRVTFTLFIIYIAAILLLTTVPHAVLLSATGRLWPSPFSRALVPIAAFGLLLLSVAYGRTSGRFTSISDVVDSLSFGIGRAAPLFILYVLIVQFYKSLCFVFPFLQI